MRNSESGIGGGRRGSLKPPICLLEGVGLGKRIVLYLVKSEEKQRYSLHLVAVYF